MTVSSETAKDSYAQVGDSPPSTYPVTFYFLANADVKIIHRNVAGIETAWSEGSEYTLTGAGNQAGGTVTVSISPTDYRLANGETLTIKRDIEVTQETDYPEGGQFPARAHEDALDRAAMRDQQLQEEINRKIGFSETSSATPGDFPDPVSAARLVGYDAGNQFALYTTADLTGTTISSFAAELLDDVDAAAARTTLDAPQAPTTSDNAVLKANGTAGEYQDTGVTIDHDDNLYGHGAGINTQTGTSYTLTASDNGKVIELNNASAITLTVPQTSTEAIPAGFQCVIVQIGAGQVTVAKEGSDTIKSRSSLLSLTEQYAAATIIKRSAGSPNDWLLVGDLS